MSAGGEIYPATNPTSSNAACKTIISYWSAATGNDSISHLWLLASRAESLRPVELHRVIGASCSIRII